MVSIFVRFGLCAVLIPLSAMAADELDRGFGSAGYVSHAFQPTDGGRDDQAFVACAVPGGTALMVAGNASSGHRTVVAWLNDAGQLDTPFSGDGKESIALPAGLVTGGTAGACLPDGRILLAQELFDGSLQGDGDIRLTRLLPQTGLPDPAFGVAGTVSIDLDQFVPAGPLEAPIAINLAPDGDILLTGEYTPTSSLDDTTYSGFLARVDAQTFAVSVAMGHTFDASLRKFTGAGIGPDGTVWVVADHFPAGGSRDARVIRLQADTLAYLGVLHASVGAGITAGRAVMHGASLVMAGRRLNQQPFLALVTAAGVDGLLLPQAPDAHGIVGDPQVALQAPHTLMLGTGTHLGAANQGGYFARVRITSQNRLRLDASYGRNGVQITRDTGGCHSPPVQNFQRFTLWRGRPVAVGMVNGNCDAATPDFDYHATRLLEPGFGNGFE
jgi:hypothetical protein